MKLYIICIIPILLSINSYAIEVRFESDVSIKSADKNEFLKVASNEVFNTEKNGSYFVVNSQNIPLVLITSNNNDSKLLITNQDFSNVFNEKTNQLIEQKTNSIINDIRKAESLLLKKDFSQALSVINKLKENHKNISSVLFLSGTIHSLMNNKKNAIEDLESGLKIDAENTSAMNMLKKLKGAE